MEKFAFAVLASLAAFSSLQAQTYNSTSGDEELDASRHSCRWTYALEHDALIPKSAYAEQVMQGAEIESQSGNCTIRDCRWIKAMEQGTLIPGSAYAEQVMRGAKIESQNGGCSK